MIFTLQNLTETTGELRVPWEFTFAYDSIPENVRKVKADRQDWYQNPTTKHLYYSFYLGHIPHMRITKQTNPPKKIMLLAADYDCVIPTERLKEVIEAMKIKPTWIETSLGGHRRLVWVFEVPVLVDAPDFALFFLQEAKAWLRLNLLPMLDEPAWTTDSRLLCVGDKWEPTGYGPVPMKDTQCFFVACAKKFNSKNCNEVVIGLDVVEAELKKRYPTFNWPVAFEEKSQGPSFWVAGSESPNSAIVKKEGMFTFAGHAEKMFYSWSDLLGREFMAEYETTATAKATADIWFDNNHYFRKIGDRYVSMRKDVFVNYLVSTCHLSEKADKSGCSPVRNALEHIHNNQLIVGAAPAAPLPMGIFYFQKKRQLNTFNCQIMEPAVSTQHWGPHGNFAFWSALFNHFFNPIDQLEDYLAWGQYYYEGAKNRVCRPGPAMYLGGPPDCGKTFISRSLWGEVMGGYADASQYILKGSAFNSHLFEVLHWTLDDDSTSASDYIANQSHMMVKKVVANPSFEYHRKFEVPCETPWGGRVHCAFNLDETSGRVVGTMDESMLDKICLLLCADIRLRADGFKFPARGEILKLALPQLPYFLRWLLDHTPPDRIVRIPERFGFKPRHEDSLLQKAKASSAVGPFKEVVLSTLLEWFAENPDATEHTTTLSLLSKRITSTSVDNTILRGLKVEKLSGYMEQLGNEKFLNCKSNQAPHNIRVWTFQRPTA